MLQYLTMSDTRENDLVRSFEKQLVVELKLKEVILGSNFVVKSIAIYGRATATCTRGITALYHEVS